MRVMNVEGDCRPDLHPPNYQLRLMLLTGLFSPKKFLRRQFRCVVQPLTVAMKSCINPVKGKPCAISATWPRRPERQD